MASITITGNSAALSSLNGALSVNYKIDGALSSSSNLVGALTLDLAEYGNSNAEDWYNIIQELGISATVRTRPSKTFNTNTQQASIGQAVDYTVKVIPPYRNREGYKETELISSGIGLSGIINYKLNFQVKKGIKLIINSKTWTVTGIQEISDKTGILVYILEIQSGN